MLLHRLNSLVTPHVESNSVLFVPCGSVASSATAMIYLFRQVNHIPSAKFVALEDLASHELDVHSIVLLDDFAGTGHSVIRLWRDHIAPLQRQNPERKFIFGCMVAHDTAVAALHAETGFVVEVAEVIPSSERAFGETSSIFQSMSEREDAKLVIKKYSSHVPPRGIYGYSDTQSLVSFFFNTPDNTFPLFWMSSEKWKPLLPHGADPMLFASEIVAGRGPTLPTSASTIAVQQLHDLDEPEIDADSAVLLLQEFSTTNVLHRFQPIIASLKLRTQPLGALLRATHKLRHAVHEQHSVRTAIFIVPDSQPTLQQRFYLKPTIPTFLTDDPLLRQMCELVNGLRGAIVASPAGEVLGALTYNDAPASPGLPERLANAAAESKNLGALAFVFVGNGRITVLAGGERIVTHRQSTWYLPPPRLFDTIRKAEQTHGIDDGILRRVYDLSLEMSDSGEGAIFVVGDVPAVTAICDTRPSAITLNAMTFDASNLAAIRALALQDGALIVDARGHVLRGMNMLRPPASAVADVPPGTGARHSSAAKTTAVTDSVAVVVSSDGAISFFGGGKRFLVDMT